MKLRLTVIVMCLVLLVSGLGAHQGTEVPEDRGPQIQAATGAREVTCDPPAPRIDAIMGRHILENQGQLLDDDVLYYATTPGLLVAFRSDGLNYLLTEPSGGYGHSYNDGPARGWCLRVTFDGSLDAVPVPGPSAGGTFNFLLGSDADGWTRSVQAYDGLRYPGLWEGVDLVYRLDGDGLKYDLEVQPGADIDSVRFVFEGHTDLLLEKTGALVVHTPLGDLVEDPPVARYTDGGMEEVDVRFSLQDGDAIGFEIEARDVDRTLLIDPLVYSGFMGSGPYGQTKSMDVVADDEGRTYIVGGTQDRDYVTTPGAFQTDIGGWADAFVARISSDGTSLDFCTFLGGSSYDFGVSIDLDPEGNVYVGGYSQSEDFPLSPDAFDSTMEIEEVFVSKLSSDGSSLIYSTFVGGSGYETGAWIVVDHLGCAYLTGRTNSTDLPTTEGAYIPGDFRQCAFISKLNENGTDLVYSTYYRFSAFAWETYPLGIDLDPSGRAYIVGYASFQQPYYYDEETFVIRVNAKDCGIKVLMHLDWNGRENGCGIVVDRGRDLYITGSTTSTDMPAMRVYSTEGVQGYYSSFVLKYDVLSDRVDYTVLFRGMNAKGIAVDSNGSAHVVGCMYEAGFPVTPGSYQPTFAGYSDGILCKLSPGGRWIEYATYLGGRDNDYITAIDLDGDSNVCLTGGSVSSDFPTTPGTFNEGGPRPNKEEVFVCKFPSWHLRPPRADAGPNQSVAQHHVVVFNGGRSTDDESILSWTWTFMDGGREVALDGSLANYTFEEAGVYEVVLNVTDGRGNWDTDRLTVTVRDITSPIAVVEGERVVDQHCACVLNASGSLDNVGVANWTWTLGVGDSTFVQYGPSMNFTFDDPGTYQVVLVIGDAAGNLATDVLNVTVNDTTAPVAWAGLDISVIQSTVVDLDCTGSSDNVGIVNWTWLFEYDGTEVRLHQERDSFRFDLAGVYKVSLVVHDAAGNAGWDELVVTVQDTTPPIADPGPDQSIDQHQTAHFDGSGSTDNLGIVNWTWSFYYDGREVIVHSVSFDFLFDEAGVYQVRLTARDASGLGGYDHCVLTVGDTTPPTAEAGEDRIIDQGDQVIFDGYHSRDNVGVVEWRWSFEYDGEVVNLFGEVQGFAFDHPGNYTVTLMVKDAAGLGAEDTMRVDVRPIDGPTTEPEEDVPLLFILTLALVVTLLVVGLVLWRTREVRGTD